ncbi:MAG: cytochrome c3 family protein [Chlamydiota bacterium]|nr:cytochrome c3 family protein [Chlamydiota bacterium]
MNNILINIKHRVSMKNKAWIKKQWLMLILLTALIMFSSNQRVFPEENHCITCHSLLGGKNDTIIQEFNSDIHHQKGLSCHSCHGGNPNEADMTKAMSPDAGFVGVPSHEMIPQFCARCHSDSNTMKKYNPSLPVDQIDKYSTSIHGIKLKSGDTKVAVCTSCHSTHMILPANDPISSVYVKNIHKTCGKCHANADYMKSYKIPTQQVSQYLSSVHGKALFKKGDISAPTCNDCHGNHGAIPPGIDNIALICGNCHVHNMEFFMESPMAKIWTQSQFHACTTCHQTHDIKHPSSEMLGAKKGVCINCHTPHDKGFEAGQAMKTLLDHVENALDTANQSMHDAEGKGMDVSEAHDFFQEAKQSFYQAKTAVHTFQPDKVKVIIDKGIVSAEGATKISREAIKEHKNRRYGLGFATVLLTLLILGIYLKLRDIEK